MADKILEVIMRITNFGKKKASFGKILAHLSKSDDGMGSWSLGKKIFWEKPWIPWSNSWKLPLFPKAQGALFLINHKPLKDH